jgi:outer membrane biosynthesis protein TonB
VERSTGKFLLDNVQIEASTTFMTYDDMLTGMQSAAPRVADELARNIVDTILALWTPKKEEKPAPAIEAKAPEAQAPEVKAPEAPVLDVKAPETKAPEAQAPETKVPDVKAPEVKKPEIKIPEGGLLIQLPQETEDQLKPRKYR